MVHPLLQNPTGTVLLIDEEDQIVGSFDSYTDAQSFISFEEEFIRLGKIPSWLLSGLTSCDASKELISAYSKAIKNGGKYPFRIKISE